jgi:hypothetical protein
MFRPLAVRGGDTLQTPHLDPKRLCAYSQATILHLWSTKMGTKRTPVALTESEREELERAMARYGIRSMSDFLRLAALYAARKGELFDD